MKQIISWICVVAMLFLLLGCTKVPGHMQEPVAVYYCASPTSYHSPSGILRTEELDFNGWHDNLREFLNRYLSGPSSTKLSSPFPTDGSILTITQNGEEMDVVLSVQFLLLTQNELILAYACLSMTIFEITDAEAVNLHVYGTNAEKSVVTMTRDNLWFTDTTETE